MKTILVLKQVLTYKDKPKYTSQIGVKLPLITLEKRYDHSN